MKIRDLMKMGLRNLRRRKARTMLTVIGVMIGTISIVVMISIGMGMNANFDAAIMQNGAMTTINVSSNQWVEQEDGSYGSVKQKLNDDVLEMLRGIEHVEAASPLINAYGQFYTGKYQTWASMTVIDFEYYEALGYPALEDGTYPTKADSKKFLFGSSALNDFYMWSGRTTKYLENFDITKNKVTLKFTEYQTSGKREFEHNITEYAMLPAEEYGNYSWTTFVDVDNYRDLYEKYSKTLKPADRKKAAASLKEYEQIIINVDNMNNVTAVQDELKELGLASSSDMQYIEPMRETSRMLQTVLGAIGGIAMLVSAINIANTMIMSIYERTKEIGIMKVLGCFIKDIKKLFLFESGMIGLLGSIVGIVLSYGASWLINTYGGELFASLMNGNMGMAGEAAAYSIIPIWLPLLAAAFGIFVGVVSGYIPARRATKISAIEAMRTEG